jgi:hypothetical protein
MKSIEISDEMYAKLIELATEMTTQDPRGTRMPHLFQIRDWKRVYDWNLNGNIKCWIDPSADFCVVETLADLKDYLENCDILPPENIEELWEDGYDIQDWIEENCEDLKECSYSMEPVYTNSFLTAKAAQAHLDTNDYHYHKDADVYLNHAWRNPEAELVTEFLCNLVNKKMHT